MEAVEILYNMACLSQLRCVTIADVCWLDSSDSLEIFNRHLLACGQTPHSADEWQETLDEGTLYCGLFINGDMVARAAVERYSIDKWETADVRVVASERNRGYAKQVVYFVTRYILENRRTATIRTREDNVVMRRVIASLGFTEAGEP